MRVDDEMRDEWMLRAQCEVVRGFCGGVGRV